MASDYTNVVGTLSADGNDLSITGQATTTSVVDTPVHVTTVISAGSDSETIESDGVRAVSTVTPEATNITSVSDDIGGVWTIAPDGQSAHQG